MDNKYQIALNRLQEETISNPYTLNHNDEDISTLQKLVNKDIALKVKWEELGYDSYANVNVYGAICPSCDLHIFEFDDNDVEVESPDSKEIRKGFYNNFTHHAKIGLNNYCSRCGQRLDWSTEDGK